MVCVQNRYMSFSLTIPLILLFLVGTCFAQEKASESTQEFDVETSLETFDQVWSTIKKTHWDEELVGQKWDQARDKYRPLVKEAKSVSEIRKILNDLIGELGQSHFGIIPADAYEVVGNETPGGDGHAGIEFRATDDGILVTRVEAGSPGEAVGIKPGWKLESIGERDSDVILEKSAKAAHGPMRSETIVGLTLQNLTSGQIGDQRQMLFRDEKGATQEVNLELVEQPGNVSKLGNLPAAKVHYEAKTLEGQIGYFRFNLFLDPVRIMPAFRQHVQDEKHSNGIIIDLRGNRGGLGAMTMGMAKPFVNEMATLGVMSMKGAELKFAVAPGAESADCPVAILVDNCSISSSEIYSGGMQDLGRARIFGQRTAGLALPSVITKLPNGDGFQYAIANYVSASGKSLEMDGVTPDETIELNQQNLIQQGDPTLAAAMDWLKKQNTK